MTRHTDRRANRRASDLAGAGAERADREGRLDDPTADSLVDAGYARYFVPPQHGGNPGGFAELLDLVAELAEGGGTSAAWCAMLLATHGRFAAFLPPDGQHELWARTPDTRIAAGITPPAGTATPADGGWLLDGSWPCVSGAVHADWALLAAWETTADGRRARVFAVPAEAFTVRPSWDAIGLRGTGSDTVVVEAASVPAHRTFLLSDLLNGQDGQDGRDGEAARCYAVPAHLPGAPLFCAPALGAARRALAVWSRWAAGKSGGAAHRDSAAVRDTLARAAAGIDAAGLLLEAAARRADHEPVTELLVARGRRDAAYAAELLVGAVEQLLRTGGAHVRDGGGELPRLWRDVHTVVGHGVLRLEPAAEAYAAAALSADAPA